MWSLLRGFWKSPAYSFSGLSVSAYCSLVTCSLENWNIAFFISERSKYDASACFFYFFYFQFSLQGRVTPKLISLRHAPSQREFRPLRWRTQSRTSSSCAADRSSLSAQRWRFIWSIASRYSLTSLAAGRATLCLKRHGHHNYFS